MRSREAQDTMENRYVLALDLGTSGPKAALVSSGGTVLHSTFERTPLLLLPSGGAEQDPNHWWEAIRKAVGTLLQRSQVPAEEIEALCCTSQWSGTVAVDREGRHLMNAIIWMDSRGAPFAKAISGGWPRVQGYGIGKLFHWLRKTGGIPAHSGKDPIAHILYVKHVLPEVYRGTYKFLEPKDYINLRFTGRFAASYDSIALHWVTDNRNIHRVVYDEKLIAMSTIDGEKLPELKQATEILGPIRKDVADDLGLGHHVRVVMGTPDVQSAAIGSGAVRDYAGHLYIGTSSWLTCHVPFKKTDIVNNMASLPSAIPGKYFVANEQETAGACVDFLIGTFLNSSPVSGDAESSVESYAHAESMARSAPAGSGKVIFMPWLYGERTPIEDSTVRGGFFNLSLKTTREHCVRAVYEGVAYNSRWLLQCVEKFIKRRMETVHMIGGGALSDLWCQIHADVLDRVVRQVKDPIHANIRGAAYLALTALGLLDFDDVAGHTEIAATYEPCPENRGIYDELFGEFTQLYKRNKGIYARLNRSPQGDRPDNGSL
ncbi:FGGY-family carbohydrate kinase [Thermodesulfobacteriota bacterium]